MKPHESGLICAGRVNSVFLARMPSVLATLGPVKSSSLRVARRMTNSLHAGRPVESSASLRGCEIIWIVVPEEILDHAIRDLPPPGREFIVVCGSLRGSDSFDSRARMATLNAVDPEEHVVVAEGHPDAVRALRRVMALERRKLIELLPSTKPFFNAGANLAAHMVLPAYSAAVESLRAAGFSRADATSVAATLANHAILAYGKAGKRAWNSAAAAAFAESLERDVSWLRDADSRIAETYEVAVRQALRYFET